MDKKEQLEESRKFPIKQWVAILAISFFFTILLKSYAISTYSVKYPSMEDALLVGDYLMCEKITYKKRLPKKGELVVFRYPLNPDKVYIKRCVAVPGDTVMLVNKLLYLNCCLYPDPPTVKYTDTYIIPPAYSTRDNMKSIVIGFDCIFVMGDNRDNSNDSRFWGPLEKKFVEAKPMFIYFSIMPYKQNVCSTGIWETILNWFRKVTTIPSRIRWNRIGMKI